MVYFIFIIILNKKIDVYVNIHVDMNVKLTVNCIQDLCEMMVDIDRRGNDTMMYISH